MLWRFNKIKSANRELEADIKENEKKSHLKKDANFDHILLYEGRMARSYWDHMTRVFQKLAPSFNFQGRSNKMSPHNRNASDDINALLNYGYALLDFVILTGL